MAAKLTNLGFLKGIIEETIVSTYNKDATPNAAPMGVTMIDDEHLTIDFFNTSKTYANIRALRCAVINLTSDIELFYKTGFKEANQDGALPQEWFEKTAVVNAPKLRVVDAAIEISLYHLEPAGEEKAKAFFKVRSLQAHEKCPQVYCRAFSATLEAIIYATRVKVLINDEKQRKSVSELLKKIGDCNEVVSRVAPNSQYSLIMADLIKRIDSWG